MTAVIKIDGRDWPKEIEQSANCSEQVCRKMGGIFSWAVLYDVVKPKQQLNVVFQKIACWPQRKITAFVEGYLYWRLQRDAKQVRIITKSTTNLTRKKQYFERLFKDLDANALKLTLPFIDSECLQLMMVGNADLFKRCWKVISASTNSDRFVELRFQIFEHLRTKKAGIKKAVYVASEDMLATWIAGDITKPLHGADPDAVNNGDNEFDVLQDVSMRMLPEDLPRVWTVMQSVWSDERMMSMGIAFSQGLKSRKDAASPSIINLVDKVNGVVAQKRLEKEWLNREIDVICARLATLTFEFDKGYPFARCKL